MHLGNAWAFLLAWLFARNAGGRVILRIEDLDAQRSKQRFVQSIYDDLHWLGLDWDEGPDTGGVHAPYLQSLSLDLYSEALASLETQGLTYSCFCTRKDLRSVHSAPQIGDMGVPYPGTCRKLTYTERQNRFASGLKATVRFACDEQELHFTDVCCGEQRTTLQQCGGDFALRRSDGVFAYQLAVAVDDARMGITHVIRGRDILPSTPRQIVLLRKLGKEIPTYAHIPLLLDEDGERLAKRHQSLSLCALRETGVAASAIVGLLGMLAGLNPSAKPMSPHDLVPSFRLANIPHNDLLLTNRQLQHLAQTAA